MSVGAKKFVAYRESIEIANKRECVTMHAQSCIPKEDRKFFKFSRQWHVQKRSAQLLDACVQKFDWTFSEEARDWMYGSSGPESISRKRQAVSGVVEDWAFLLISFFLY